MSKDFKVGDRVRIRQWDGMAREFGLVSNSDYEKIDCRFTFTRNMMSLCGKKFTISEIDDDGRIYGLDDAGYSISKDMLEEAGWFTTAEAFERLGANHERRFKRVSDGLVIDIQDGKYHWEPGHGRIGPSDEWEEISKEG